MTDTNNTLKKGLLDVRVPNDIYSSFVSNYRSDIIIGPSNINKMVLKDANSGSTSTTINFTATTQSNLLFSNLIKMESDITFTFSNVRVKADNALYFSSLRQSGGLWSGKYENLLYAPSRAAALEFQATTTNETADEVHKRHKITSANVYDSGFSGVYSHTGLSPNPFQVEWAPCCNFLNSYFGAITTLSLANNGNPVQMSTTPKLHDVLCRSLDEEDIMTNWNGALIPTKSVVRGQRFHMFEKRFPLYDILGNIAGQTDPDDGLPKSATVTFPTHFPTYLDIENDCNAATNSFNRGQMDRNLEVVWTFTKAIESKNYTLQKIAGNLTKFQLKEEAATTSLNVLIINGYAVPSHIYSTDFTNEQIYAIMGDACFYYPDMASMTPLAKAKIDKGTGGYDGEWNEPSHIFYCHEPLNQSLTITKTYKKMTMPVFNPILSSSKSTACWSNTTYFNLSSINK